MNRQTIRTLVLLSAASFVLSFSLAVRAQAVDQQAGQQRDALQQQRDTVQQQRDPAQVGQPGQQPFQPGAQDQQRQGGLADAYVFSVDQLTQNWPEESKKAAQQMRQQYGQPSGMTPSRIIWQDKGPWKEIVVYKEPVQHDFPMPHTDVLEQTINYQVPADKFDELAHFDGSVFAERTKGTLSARCDKEAANYLALNLAHDIITDRKTVDQARQEYAQAIQQMMAGQPPQNMQRLAFQPQPQAGDKDVAVIQGQPGEAQPAAERQQQQPGQQQPGQQQPGQQQPGQPQPGQQQFNPQPGQQQ